MSTTPTTPSAGRRAVRGALGGAILFGLGGFIGSLLTRESFAGALQLGLVTACVGAMIFAIGRGVAQGIRGAALLGVVGMFLGASAGKWWGGVYTYDLPSPVQPGQPLEIAGPTLVGDQFDVDQWRGKVVLVDFWATWCGPCLVELPNVRRVYQQYRADGFEVVGVSLDRERDRLTAFVTENDIPWPQIFFPNESERGWNNPLARKYGIEGIPTTILLNREGRVVDEATRGPALETAVARLLGKQTAEKESGPGAFFRVRQVQVPISLYGGLLLGCLAGSFVGAWLECGLRRALAR